MRELLSPGGPYTLTQNTVYALPARAVYAEVISGKTIETSLDGSNFEAVTVDTNGVVLLAAPFVRSTEADTIISLKHL
jgi:hypothetical protein